MKIKMEGKVDKYIPKTVLRTSDFFFFFLDFNVMVFIYNIIAKKRRGNLLNILTQAW
jgi:hypothetical protein